MNAYVLVSNLVCLTAGGFGGYHLCLFVAKRREPSMSESNHKTAKGVGWLIGALALMLAGVVFVVQQYERDADATSVRNQFANYKKCVNDYAKVLHDSQTARSDASALYQSAQQRLLNQNTHLWSLVTEILSSGKPLDTNAALNALGQYRAAAAHEAAVLRHLQQEREAHPYPDPPAKACQ